MTQGAHSGPPGWRRAHSRRCMQGHLGVYSRMHAHAHARLHVSMRSVCGRTLGMRCVRGRTLGMRCECGRTLCMWCVCARGRAGGPGGQVRARAGGVRARPGGRAGAVRAAQAEAAAAAQRAARGRPHPVGAPAAAPHRGAHAAVRPGCAHSSQTAMPRRNLSKAECATEGSCTCARPLGHACRQARRRERVG